MSNLAIVSLVLGIVAVVGRAPLIFAPGISLEIIRKIIDNTLVIRIGSIIAGALSAACLYSAWGSEQSAALIILIMGWHLAIVALFALTIPPIIQLLGDIFWSINNKTARVVGVISVGFGVLLIYLGCNVF